MGLFDFFGLKNKNKEVNGYLTKFIDVIRNDEGFFISSIKKKHNKPGSGISYLRVVDGDTLNMIKPIEGDDDNDHINGDLIQYFGIKEGDLVFTINTEENNEYDIDLLNDTIYTVKVFMVKNIKKKNNGFYESELDNREFHDHVEANIFSLEKIDSDYKNIIKNILKELEE